jgi:Restriction endonuclease
MAAKRSGLAWRRHELVSKAIFEALLKQNNAENLEVKHNVRVKGDKTSHQIDVFWKFRMGGVNHIVIVEVKKGKRPVNQGKLLKFLSVLGDIPGQPRGIFVSEHGYQEGALKVASAAGIQVYEIREVNREARRDPVTIPLLSIATITQKPDQVALEWTILSPTLTHFRLELDGLWLAQHPEVWPRAADQRKSTAVTGIVSLARFLDAAGNERTSVRALVQARVKELGQAGQTQLEVEFPDPTYVSGLVEGENKDGNPIGDIKCLKFSSTLEVTKTTITCPMFSATTSTYLFRNAVEDDNRYVLIAERGSDLAAHLSLALRNVRITTSDPRILAVSPSR